MLSPRPRRSFAQSRDSVRRYVVAASGRAPADGMGYPVAAIPANCTVAIELCAGRNLCSARRADCGSWKDSEMGARRPTPLSKPQPPTGLQRLLALGSSSTRTKSITRLGGIAPIPGERARFGSDIVLTCVTILPYGI